MKGKMRCAVILAVFVMFLFAAYVGMFFQHGSMFYPGSVHRVSRKEAMPSASGAPMGEDAGSLAKNYLGALGRCGFVKLGGRVLVLRYVFVPAHSPLIVEYRGRDYVLNT